MKNSILSRLLVVSFLVLTAWQSTQAQDAFYIYRNDGDFDGFFYDEVKRIGYSKIDIDSIEHDNYVVQEVETLDSIYRIPLAAIDSVGFVQPELRISNRVTFVRDGLLPYIIYANNEMVVLDNNTPDNLMPSVGDVLVGLATDGSASYENGSFACKITSVNKNAGDYGHLCSGEPVTEVGEIFDQFVTVEQVGIDPDGNVRRRIAGFNEDGTPKNPSVNGTSSLNLSILDWSGHITLKDGDINSQGEDDNPLKYNIGIDLGAKINLRIVLSITGIIDKHIYLKAITTEELSAAVTGELKSEITFYRNIDAFSGIPGIMFPSFLPLFEIRPLPQVFFEAGGSMGVKFKLPSFKLSMAQTLTIDNEDPWLVSLKWGDREKKPKSYDAAEPDGSWLTGAEFKLSGWLYGGCSMPVTIETNHWLEKIFHASIGTTIKAGPKIEGSLIISSEGEGETLAGSGIDITTLDITQSTGVTGTVRGKSVITREILGSELKLGTIHLGAAPEITCKALNDQWTCLQAGQDGSCEWSGLASVAPQLSLKGNVFHNMMIGVQLVKSDKPLNSSQAGGYEGHVNYVPATSVQWLTSYSFTSQPTTVTASPLTITEWGPISGFPEVYTRYLIRIVGRYMDSPEIFTITHEPIHEAIMAGSYPY